MKPRATFSMAALKWLFLLLAMVGSTLAVAAIPNGTGPDTVDVTYDDNFYIDYRLNGIWHRSLVSVGGASAMAGGTLVSSQLYCVDPAIPYYERANVSTIDPGPPKKEQVTMGGYTVISPPEISPTMPKNWNWDAISWLVINGYQGDYYANDATSQASVARLKTLYPALSANITPEVAMIATKVAIWQIAGGSSFQFLSSSVDTTTVQALAQAMVADALAAPPGTGVPATPPPIFR